MIVQMLCVREMLQQGTFLTIQNLQCYKDRLVADERASFRFDIFKYSRAPSPPPPPPPISPPIFKSQIGFFLVIHESFHRRFQNTAAFSSFPRFGGIGRDNCTCYFPLISLKKEIHVRYTSH